MKVTPHQFNAFAQVMRAGSFSAAARAMGVTQSAVTQQIARLEQQVGARLLLRSAAGLELTQAGRDLFDLAERYSALSQEIDERIAGYTSFDAGHLTIIANAPQPALQMIARYGRRYPQIEVTFTLFDWTRATAMLADHSVDIAFITQPRITSDCVYKRLCAARYVLYVRPDHPLAGREQVSLAALSSERLILPERGSLTQKEVTFALAKAGVSPRQRMSTTTFPVMKEAILSGVGVGIFLSNAGAGQEGVVQIPIREFPDPYDIHAAVPRHKFGLRLIKSFWDELVVAP